VLSLAVTAPPASGFDTSTHATITVEALRAEGFSQSAADVVRLENWLVDLYSSAKVVPQSGHADIEAELAALVVFPENWPQSLVDAVERLHFDYVPNTLIATQGVGAEWDRLRRATWVHARAAAHLDKRPLDLLAVLGISLHQVQDFYSHSNWIEPRLELGLSGPGWAALGYGDVPTWFDVPPGVRDAGLVTTGGTPGQRSHGGWKANGNTSLLTAMAKDWPGRPLYVQAHMAAYFATRQWVRAVRAWVGDDAFWAQAQRFRGTPSLAKDLAGSRDISLYAGRWQGQGGPCKPPLLGGCDATSGPGGSLIHLRQATNGFFRNGKSIYRFAFERLAPAMAVQVPPGELHPVPSSRELQQTTRFIQLQVRSMRGIDLGDPATDQADLYARATILGQDYLSAVIHGHDRYGFPRPNYPFTWLRAVPADYRGGEPVREITVRVRTSSARFAGTDDSVFLRLGPRLRFPLDKRLYDDFERGDDDTYSVPIDAAARIGLNVGDVRQLTIEKGPDRIGGAWKLRGVTFSVNGRVVYARDRIERWLEKSRRTWTAPGFRPRSPTGHALPVWLDLREDDLVYGLDDQGDVNPYGHRRAIALAYVPGTVVDRTFTGGNRYGGRTGDGGEASVRLVLRTLEPTPPPEPPAPQPPPPAGSADLAISVDSMAFVVRNGGNAAAGPFTVTVVGFGTFRIDGLGVGGEVTRAYTNRCFEGSREARADALGEIQESDETNNVATAQIIC
jgi:hypothetical protein